MARPATPPEPSEPPVPSPVHDVRLPARIDRADVDEVVARSRAGVRAMPAGRVVPCDAADVVDPALPTVDVIARIALELRREDRLLRLEHAPPELLDLLALCGLESVAGVRRRAPLSRRGGPAGRRAGRTARCRGRT